MCLYIYIYIYKIRFNKYRFTPKFLTYKFIGYLVKHNFSILTEPRLRRESLTFGVTWGGHHSQLVPAELNLLVRLQEHVRLGTAAARYHGSAAGQHGLQSTRSSDVVGVHMCVHCNSEKNCRGVKSQSLLPANA